MKLKKESFIELENTLSEVELSDGILLHLDNCPRYHIVSKQDTIIKKRLKIAVNNQSVPNSLEDSIQDFIQE